MHQPWTIFVHFRSFEVTNFTEKTVALQQDSNLERQSRRKTSWPLDHYHPALHKIDLIDLYLFNAYPG